MHEPILNTPKCGRDWLTACSTPPSAGGHPTAWFRFTNLPHEAIPMLAVLTRMCDSYVVSFTHHEMAEAVNLSADMVRSAVRNLIRAGMMAHTDRPRAQSARLASGAS